ncbi:MAG: sigma-54-dependent Fis family transcriptional regulator [Myxococcales bacterium]|nr:sigma-54-dependent Fis family transcriptional regulator [Myxococcales bacterium]
MEILLVDDDLTVLRSVERFLRREGHEVVTASSGVEAMLHAKNHVLDAALLDLHLPDTDGIRLSKSIRELQPVAQTMIMTAFGSVDTAVRAMREGVYDYLTKPINFDELAVNLSRVAELTAVRKENQALRVRLERVNGFRNLVGRSGPMQDVLQRVELAASSDSTVLITGETGTGKEMVVDAIHAHSDRRDFPLVKVGCCILPESLIESEIFGHEKGAFTGAQRTRSGRFEVAHRGTLFLDDVDDIPLDVQAKLLRFLENNTFERVGGNKTITVDVRVVAATKKNLLDLVRVGRFRDDLYYRLSVVPIHLPPLRERPDDVPLLVRHFLTEFSGSKMPVEVESDAMQLLAHAVWPGNVRELRNAVELLYISRANDRITAGQIENWLGEHSVPTWSEAPTPVSGYSSLRPSAGVYDLGASSPSDGAGPSTPNPRLLEAIVGESGQSLIERLSTFEEQILRDSLERNEHNKAATARELAIPVSTLKSKLKKFNIE